jgi:hypothetical protein
MLRTAAQLVIDRLPWDELMAVLRRIAERRLPAALVERIDDLVAAADRGQSQGVDKFKWVVQQLQAEGSPVRQAALSAAGVLLHWAIESAVLRLRAARDA